MTSQVEAAFRARCSENEAFQLLLAQWEYEKRLASRALALVGHTFPHFSLHDGSHSETILMRIGSILGDRLQDLSATNLWLILHGAYMHDTGMVALHAKRIDDFRSEPFVNFLRHLESGGSENRDHAIRISRGLQDTISLTELASVVESLTIVYAEFVRSRHALRSSESVLHPLSNLGVDPPRTLIPARFWVTISQIVRGHGESLDWVISSLPREASGFGGDICNPRFAACMLRLGDLLDLDSGRFCPSLLGTLSKTPTTSGAHFRKHEGVRHLLVTPRRIEVDGEYTDMDAYLLADQWLTWLREELANQQAQWDEIAPASVSSLPSCGPIRARLKDQIVFAPGQRPRFEVDRERLIELARGANIYSGPHDAVRELLQNSIDATILRYAYENKGKPLASDPSELRSHLQRWPVKIAIAQCAPCTGEQVDYRLSIEDMGIGMAQTDLEHLLKLGSSSKNESKLTLVHQLPEWMKPSGTFGFGFHSIFEHCESATLETRHVSRQVGYILRFLKDASGEVHVTATAMNDEQMFLGTRLTCVMRLDAIPPKISGDIVEEFSEQFSKYDFVAHDHIPYCVATILSRVSLMMESSPVPIICDSIPDGEPQVDADGLDFDPTRTWIFDKDRGGQIRLANGWSNISRFRGSPVEDLGRERLVSFEFDLLNGNARELLNISRNKWTQDGRSVIWSRARESLRWAVPQILDRVSRHLEASDAADDSVKSRRLRSTRMRLSAMAFIDQLPIQNSDDRVAWKELSVGEGECQDLTLEVLHSAKMVTIRNGVKQIEASGHTSRNLEILVTPQAGDVAKFTVKSLSEWVYQFLEVSFHEPTIDEFEDQSSLVFRFEQGGSHGIAAAAVANVFWPESSELWTIGRREFVPLYPQPWASILDASTRSLYYVRGRSLRQKRIMASPFTIDNDLVQVAGIDEYLTWLVSLRRDAGLTCDPATVREIGEAFVRVVSELHTQWCDVPERKARLGFRPEDVAREVMKSVEQAAKKLCL